MTDKAKELLIKMANEFDISGQSSFDSTFYCNVSEKDIVDLENDGYIVIKDDIVGSMYLTDIGYQKAKK